MARDLSPLFEPRGVVVTGVSSHPGKFGFVALHNILSCGFAGPVVAVGREEGSVLGLPVHPSIEALPDGVADLLVLCTPVAANEEIVRTAAARGVRAVFCAAGGYSEAGPDGAEAERRLVALADELGLVLAGPNGQGVVSPPAGLCAQIVAPFPPRGRIAVASQSGNFVSAFLNYAGQTGIGISRAVSAGNAAAEILVEAGHSVRPGVTTDRIDAVVHEATIARGGYPSPLNYRGYPKSVCTSVNEVICHGIPDSRPLADGDIVNIDVTIFLDGVHGDTSVTFLVGEADDHSRRLVAETRPWTRGSTPSVRPSR
jgi:predicted CoA-binding protein